MSLASANRVELCHPDNGDRLVIKNLFTFYRYDLMPFMNEVRGARVNAFGCIGDDDATTHEHAVAEQDIWWTKPGILLPMLIRANGEPAGFALVACPPHAHHSVDYRVEDFFILNKWQRAGIGRRAVEQLFERHSGCWEIGWLPRNIAAHAFWRAVAAQWEMQDWIVSQAPGTPGLPGIKVSIGRKEVT